MKGSVSEFSIRALENRDLDQLFEVDQICSRVPWSKAMLSSELRFPESYLFGAFCSEKLVGFLIGRVMVDEVHILNLVVLPNYRRKGIADVLISYALPDFAALDLRWATLEVRKSNVAAISLYRKFGFIEIGTRKGYYSDNGEDAFLFTADLRNFAEAPLKAGNS